jgi:hypothetical protein
MIDTKLSGDDVQRHLLDGVSNQFTWRYIFAYRVEYLVYTDWVERESDPKYDKFKVYRQRLRDWFDLDPNTATGQEFWERSNAEHPGELYNNPFHDNDEYQDAYDEASILISNAYADAEVTVEDIEPVKKKLDKWRSDKQPRALA